MEATHVLNMAEIGLNVNLAFTLVFAALFAVIAVVAASLKQASRRWWLLAVGVTLLAIASLQLEGAARVICLDLSALLAVALVWDAGTPQAKKAARLYFWMLLAALVCIAAGLLLAGEGAPFNKLVILLILVGFALKLALVPFYFWLPAVAESAAPLTSAIIISLVDMASFSELIHLRGSMPWVFEDALPLWIGLALLSMFGGALLALAQRDLKRMLAYSTIDDMGYLLLALTAGTPEGFSGAVLGALSHAVFKVLLFAAVAVPEARLGRNLTLSDRGLAARYPVCGAAFIIGALGMIGVPPTLGFVGRWRVYLTGSQMSVGVLAVVMAAATGLALLYYVRAIHRVWLGQSDAAAGQPEPRSAAAALVVVSVLAIGLGVFPAWWTALLP